MSRNATNNPAKPGLAFLNSNGWPSLKDHRGETIRWHQSPPHYAFPTSSWDLSYAPEQRLRVSEATPIGSRIHSQGCDKGWPPGTVLRIKDQIAVVVMIHWQHYPVVDILGFVTANPQTARGALWAAIAGASQLDTLILGPTGSGKERIAHIVHTARCIAHGKGPFVSINTGALPTTLFASELFGFERGAFTGADRAVPGAFRSADGGVLFLDEIGEADESAQVALLRAVENREIRPVGARNNYTVNLTIVAATNRPISGRKNSIREDLLYRLSGAVVTLPPLKDRKEDILPLACQFLATNNCAPTISPETIATFNQRPWNGNVRELQRVLRRVSVLSGGAQIHPEILRAALQSPGTSQFEPPSTMDPLESEILRIGELPTSERQNGWRRLGLSKSTYYRRLQGLKNRIQPPSIPNSKVNRSALALP